VSEQRRLRWTEQAVDQLGAIAEYVSRSSPVYAEQLVQRIVSRLEQVVVFPASGSAVAEAASAEVRQVLEWPYRIIYRRVMMPSRCSRSSMGGAIFERVN
jgi:plasmid stabilization system protein ParE